MRVSIRTQYFSRFLYIQITSRLSVTIFVEDVNIHTPEFIGTPYHTTMDELTPVGK